MLKLKYLLAVFLIFCLAFSGVAWSEEIEENYFTLEELIEIGLNDSPRIKLAQFDLRSAELELDKIEAQSEADVSRKERETVQERYLLAEDAVHRTKEELAFEIKREYINLLKSIQNVDLRKRDLEDAEKALEIAERRVEAGLKTVEEIELEGLNLDLEEARNRLIFSEAALETQKMEFNQLMGRDIDKPLEPVDDIAEYEITEYKLDHSIEQALESRRDMKDARSKLEDAEKDYEQYKFEYAAPAELEKAKMNVSRAKIEMLEKEEDIVIQVRKIYYSLLQAENNIIYSQDEAVRRGKHLELQERRYEKGYISFSAIQSVRRSFKQAEMAVNEAIYDYKLAEGNFLRTLGLPYGPLARD